MILHPAVIALLAASLLVVLMIAYAAYWGWRITEGWSLQSSSEEQLCLEKKTYLISTLMAWTFSFQILSFFLLVFVADALHRLFVGAMCAAGTLNANEYGYSALLLKLLNCVLGGVWLVLNHTDNQAPDYPLIRRKYSLLLVIAPLIGVESSYIWLFFLNLQGDVITSCCGSLFSADDQGVAGGLAGLPAVPMQVAFFGILAITLGAGAFFLLKQNVGKLFAVAGTLALPVSVAALVSFISIYFYQLPTHHCPFCILQGEYHYAGYLLYTTILGGGIASAGLWILSSYRSIPSLKEILPRIQRRLTYTVLTFYSTLAVVVLYQMAFSDFILTGN